MIKGQKTDHVCIQLSVRDTVHSEKRVPKQCPHCQYPEVYFMNMIRALSVDALNGRSTDVKGQPLIEKRSRGPFFFLKFTDRLEKIAS